MLHIVSFVGVSALSSAVQKNGLSKMDLKVGIKLWERKLGGFLCTLTVPCTDYQPNGMSL